ncbi:MAG TPA: HAMP domain-containing sensor histidine kinase [Candidatus Paceibacterota bacterium]|jgi:signal transduction histidine kinase|nr:HAMP domain-containing sensor histidine kinase [Candidatus Paceibacterota bacterium]
MRKFWKQLGAWGTGLKRKFAPDIFSTARFKIAFLYLVMGVMILGVAGYLVYARILSLIQSVLGTITQLLANPSAAGSASTASLITQAINTQVAQLNMAVGLWVFVTLVVSAYILAGITLWPIRRAMERQRRFIANVSHELRTPLSVMKTESEVALMTNRADGAALALDGTNGGASSTELLETVKSNLQEIDRLSRITQFLLDFSNFESRLARFDASAVDLALIVGNAAKLIEKIAGEKGVALVLASGPGSVPQGQALVEGNPVGLEEMTLNILKNAVNYTPAGGTVTVNIFRSRRGYQRYGWVTLAIRDTGIGIPPEDLPHLFEPFYRGKRAIATHDGDRHSAGLGLAIVKEIADLHKAAITVKSVVGEGTSIAVRFAQI